MNEAPIPGLEVPVSIPETVQANGTKPEETPRDSVPVFTCNTCGDTGAVRILFQSDTGLMPGKKSIACPDCKAGELRIAGASEKVADLEKALRVLKAVAVIAAILAAVALAIPAIKSDTFAKVDLKPTGEKIP